MALSAYDCKPSGSLHLGSKLYVGAPSCHIGGYGDGACLSGLKDNISLPLVQLGIQNIMLQALHLEHPAQQLGYFNGGSTNKNRSALFVQVDYLIYHSIILLTFGLVDKVLVVIPDNLDIGGYHNHIKLV